MDDLKAWFDEIDYAEIQRMLADSDREGLRTEFKRYAKDRAEKHLAKAISGFANVEGGLIVWGIESAKDESEIDYAAKEVPIPDADAARSRLGRMTVNATDPPVHGVDHRTVPHPKTGGFVLTYIPSSDGRPHKAKGGWNEFFRRDEFGHHPMGTAEIGDMFGRRPRPSLKLIAVDVRAWVKVFPSVANPRLLIACEVQLALQNNGRGLAHFPAVRLDLPQSWELEHFGFRELQRLAIHGSSRTLVGGVNDVIHTRSQLDIGRCILNVTVGADTGSAAPVDHVSDLVLPHGLSAADMPPVEETLTVEGDTLVQKVLDAPVSAGETVTDLFKRNRA